MSCILCAAWLGAQPPEPPAALGPLIAALHDPDVETRAYVGMALGQLGPVAVEPLMAALQDRDYIARAGAAYALGQFGTDAAPARPLLLAALKDEHRDVRRLAAYALSRVVVDKSQPAVPTLPAPVPAFPEAPPK